MSMHLAQFNQLFSQGGYVGRPQDNSVTTHWFNNAATIVANFTSAFPAPNPVVVGQNLPRPVSIVSNLYGNLPPITQSPLGTNTRI